MSLTELNHSGDAKVRQWLTQCCTAEAWVDGLLARRPFADRAELVAAADEVWAVLGEADYLEAFDGHPQIGDVDSLKARYANTKQLAAGEQAAVGEAPDEVIARLAEGNRAYADKFGFIFIVCATGKSAGEMLALLEARLPNSREQELVNAAEEQRKIFQIRLEKLL